MFLQLNLLLICLSFLLTTMCIMIMSLQRSHFQFCIRYSITTNHRSTNFVPPLRISTRIPKTPAYLNDYVHTGHQPTTSKPRVSLHTSFSNHHHGGSNILYPDTQSLVLNVSNDCESFSYEDATINPAWQPAMTQELTLYMITTLGPL